MPTAEFAEDSKLVVIVPTLGIYAFTKGNKGSKVKEYYIFIFTFLEGKLRILYHHLSMMPAGIIVPPKISKAKVPNLLHLWIDPFSTLDSDTIAKQTSTIAGPFDINDKHTLALGILPATNKCLD